MYKKKLIEVALPLEAINVASAREKSMRHVRGGAHDLSKRRLSQLNAGRALRIFLSCFGQIPK